MYHTQCCGQSELLAGTPGVSGKIHESTSSSCGKFCWPVGQQLKNQEADQQREEIERLLDSSLLAELCVHEDPTSYRIDVTLENVAAGHSFPSGSTQDRRVWVELKLYGSDELLWSSGVVDEDQAVAELDDPNLWLIRSVMRNEAGEEVHSFWEAASTEGELLEAPSTNDITDPNFEHWLRRSYVATATGATPVVASRSSSRATGCGVRR